MGGIQMTALRYLICFMLAGPIALPALVMGAQPPGKPDRSESQQCDDGIERFEFRVENKEWREVFNLLTEKTQIRVLPTCTPGGSLNHIGPKGTKYTMPEMLG